MDAKYSSAQARARVQKLAPQTSLSRPGLGLISGTDRSCPLGMLLKAENLVLGAFPQQCRETDHSAGVEVL